MNYSPKDADGKPLSPDLMTTGELVWRTGFKPDTVQSWARRGDFGAEKLGGQWRFKRALVCAELGPEAAGLPAQEPEPAVTP